MILKAFFSHSLEFYKKIYLKKLFIENNENIFFFKFIVFKFKN